MCKVEKELDIYKDIKNKFIKVLNENKVNLEENIISTTYLSGKDIFKDSDIKDYPLNNKNEVLVESRYKNSVGQAYINDYVYFEGSIEDVINLNLEDDKNKAIFISVINSVLKELGLIKATVHCKDNQPEECAVEIGRYLEKLKIKKIYLIGYQPTFIKILHSSFKIDVYDLNPLNIGKSNNNIEIKHSNEKPANFDTKDSILLVTGSSLTNNTFNQFFDLDIKVIFYGTTVAGVAYLLGLKRLCFLSE